MLMVCCMNISLFHNHPPLNGDEDDGLFVFECAFVLTSIQNGHTSSPISKTHKHK